MASKLKSVAKLKIKVRDISDSGLFTRKRVKLGSSSFETPSKALEIGNTTRKDHVSDSARGMNEFWTSVNSDKIKEAKSTMNDPLNWQTALNKAKEGEFNVAFIDYTDAERISNNDLKYMLDAVYSASDFITVPVMSGFYTAIKDSNRGTDSQLWKAYKSNVRRYVKRADNKNGKPIMGVLPYLPWAFIEEIVELYLDLGVKAFAFDFNARAATANSQVTNLIAPLMTEVAKRGLEEDVFFYSLNASKGRRQGNKNFTPSKDYLSLGTGFDVLGGKHTAISMPPDLLKKAQKDGATEVKVFERQGYYYKQYEAGEELREHFPENTDLDVDRVISRLQSSDNAKYKYQPLINGEQQSLENKNLQTTIEEERVKKHLRDKAGVTSREMKMLNKAKNKYESGVQQKSLDLW